jgi:hypothetical protein
MNFNDLFGNAAGNVTPLNAESAQPNTPVTDGADAGAGAGSEALTSSTNQANTYMASYLPVLEYLASRPGSSDSARNLVRQIKSKL